MRKFFLRSITCLLLLSVFSTSTTQAQSYCPVTYYNNSGSFGLAITDDLYNDFVDGNYLIWLISSERSDCIFYVDEPVYIAKTTNLQSTIACAPAVNGLTITFSAALCGGTLGNNELHTGFLSVLIRDSNLDNILELDYYDNEPGYCQYTPFSLAARKAVKQSATRGKLTPLMAAMALFSTL
jgi:hypothetical protein